MSLDILLKNFVNASGISGNEKEIKELMRKELKNKVDKIYEDGVGNLISVKGKGKLKVLLTSHMDEIGFMVKNVTEDGFIKLNAVGGWDLNILPSKKVLIYSDKGKIDGVIGSKAAHMQEKEDKQKQVKLKNVYVDVGAKDKKDAEKMGITVGNYVEVTGEFVKLKNKRVSGRCFDNRISCAVLTETMKKIKPKGFTVFGVGSVQEEIGLKGAKGAMFGIDPDIIISLDVCIAEDPFIKGDTSVKLGSGVTIGIQDSSFIVHEKIKKMFLEVAKKNKIPYQLGVSSGGTTEATRAILTKEGKPGGLVSVPVRYMHSTVETADLSDIESAINLLTKSLDSVKKYF